jgi:DNA-binding protein H-NS
MSVDALLKLRDEIGRTLSRRADQLKAQLSMLEDDVGRKSRGRGSAMKGRKVPIKYRDNEGHTWAGRGAQPVWLREKLEAGAKLEDFGVHKKAAARKASPKKSKRSKPKRSKKSKPKKPRKVKRAAETQSMTPKLPAGPANQGST